MVQIIVPELEEKEDVDQWIEASKQLAMDVSYMIYTRGCTTTTTTCNNSSNSNKGNNIQSGNQILEDWKLFVDWDMELTLRDTPNREVVTLEGVLEDGRAVVKEVETGKTRTLVSDYFL